MEILKGEAHLGDLDIDGRLILKYLINKQEWRCGPNSTGSG
jgi:hypothetical protein